MCSLKKKWKQAQKMKTCRINSLRALSGKQPYSAGTFFWYHARPCAETRPTRFSISSYVKKKMYVYIFVYIFICIHTQIWICIHIQIWIHISIFSFICFSISSCVKKENRKNGLYWHASDSLQHHLLREN